MGSRYNLQERGLQVQEAIDRIQGLKVNQSLGEGIVPPELENLEIDSILYSIVTKSVNDLLNYYTKSETYTKAEVQALIAAIQNMSIVPVAELPTASAETMNKIYVVPAEDPQTGNVMEEYYTKDNGSGSDPRYTWELFGSAAISLDGVVMYSESQSLTDAQKLQARTNIGATAPEILLVTFNNGTANKTWMDITIALDRNQTPIVSKDNVVYYFVHLSPDDYSLLFSAYQDNKIKTLSVSLQNVWTYSEFSPQSVANLVTSFGSTPSDTNYPSEKLVYDNVLEATDAEIDAMMEVVLN